MPEPTLTPIPPTPGRLVTLGARSPAWIGSGADSLIQIFLPGVADRHVALVEREDGWWASEGRGPATLNGRALSGTTRLQDGDTLEVTPGYRYQFGSGVAPPVAAVDLIPVEPPPNRKRRRRKPVRTARTAKPWAMFAVILVIAVLVLATAFAVWRVTRGSKAGPPLTDRQADEFDSLMVVAYDHVERGNALLEIGLGQIATQEFARAVNTLALSDLRNHPQVKPRIEALEASVAAIYRERRLTTPRAYAGKVSPLSADQLRTASLSVEQFSTAFAEVAAAFQARFGIPIEVSGRDHAEHRSLYGPGGALDLRTRTMSAEQVRFVTAACHTRKIRVKDFSQDAVLQEQIRLAIQAGLLDRVSTGLHLHIDRFGGRHDRWTVSSYHSGAAATSAGT